MATIRTIETVTELDGLFETSKQRPVWIFKHSLTCPISSIAWEEFQRFAGGRPDESGIFALIELQKARPVSNAVAQKTGVRHESPQAILVRDGHAAWHASHYGIRRERLEEEE